MSTEPDSNLPLAQPRDVATIEAELKQLEAKGDQLSAMAETYLAGKKYFFSAMIAVLVIMAITGLVFGYFAYSSQLRCLEKNSAKDCEQSWKPVSSGQETQTLSIVQQTYVIRDNADMHMLPEKLRWIKDPGKILIVQNESSDFISTCVPATLVIKNNGTGGLGSCVPGSGDQLVTIARHQAVELTMGRTS